VLRKICSGERMRPLISSPKATDKARRRSRSDDSYRKRNCEITDEVQTFFDTSSVEEPGNHFQHVAPQALNPLRRAGLREEATETRVVGRIEKQQVPGESSPLPRIATRSSPTDGHQVESEAAPSGNTEPKAK
jgi:hypothetical protein